MDEATAKLDLMRLKGDINQAANDIEQWLLERGVPYCIGAGACLEVAAFAASESKDKAGFLAAAGEMFDRGVSVREMASKELEDATAPSVTH